MISTIETSPVSLDALLAQGPVPVAQALRHALHFAQALRASHESGHGAVDSWHDAGLEALRPYTPPEVLAGSSADVRSDIYTIGAVLYHLLSGHPPSRPGNSALPPLEPPASVVPGLEACLFRCLDPNPDRRWQNLRIVSIELKLLCAAADRLQPAAPRPSVEERLRAQVSRLEAALETHIAASEQTLAGLRDAVSETRDYVRTAFEFVEDRLRCQALVIDRLETAARHNDEGLDQLTTSVALCEQSAGEFRRSAQQHAADLASAMRRIDDLHATAGRTDDLLERVVESIDSLQSFVLDRTSQHLVD